MDKTYDWDRLSSMIIRDNSRGMQDLVVHADQYHIGRAAAAVLALPDNEPVNICTGFPVRGRPETDGPAGVLVLARALAKLGKYVRIVSYSEVVSFFEDLDGAQLETCCIPCGATADRLDGHAISVEVCGQIGDGTYRNMLGQDISSDAPWFETAIGLSALISIGDGGNEFGMGSIQQTWFDRREVRKPISSCTHLIPAQVSNWGALALTAAIGRLQGFDLLPKPTTYDQLLTDLAKSNFVDGVHGKPIATEDGWPEGTGGRLVDGLIAWSRS